MSYIEQHKALYRSTMQELAKVAAERRKDDRVGSMKGAKVTVVHSADLQAQTVRPAEDQMQTVAQRSVPAAERRASTEALPLRKTPAQLFQNAHTQGLDAAEIRQGAGALIRGQASWAKWSRLAEPKAKLMAGRIALAATEENVSDDDMTAMLAPMQRQHERDPHDPHSSQDMASLLRTLAASTMDADKEAFEHFLNDVMAGLDTTAGDDVDRKKLLDELRKADKQDEQTIMRNLRKLLGIPDLHQDGARRARETLRQEILDTIGNQIHDGREGAVAFASFNAAPAAVDLKDPELFIKTFAELATQDHKFLSASKLLMSRFKLEALTTGGLLDKFKQAAGEELRAATSLRNMRWVFESASDLGHLKILSTLIDGAGELKRLVDPLIVKMAGTAHAQSGA